MSDDHALKPFYVAEKGLDLPIEQRPGSIIYAEAVMVDDERVEAVAKASYENDYHGAGVTPWDELFETVKEAGRNRARLFLAQHDAAMRFPLEQPGR